jgi:hypothetical protein
MKSACLTRKTSSYLIRKHNSGYTNARWCLDLKLVSYNSRGNDAGQGKPHSIVMNSQRQNKSRQSTCLLLFCLRIEV